MQSSKKSKTRTSHVEKLMWIWKRKKKVFSESGSTDPARWRPPPGLLQKTDSLKIRFKLLTWSNAITCLRERSAVRKARRYVSEWIFDR